MSNYISNITTLFFKDIIYNTIKNLDITPTIDVEAGKKIDLKDYLLENNFSTENVSTEIVMKNNVEYRVFDESDIDWEAAEKDIFLSLNWNDLRIGDINEMENIVRNLISMSSQYKTLTWLNQLFLDNNKNALFICTLLHVLSHMEYEEVLPQGPTMAMASLNHKDDRVIGYAIKAFSNWNSKKTIELMKTNIPRIAWAKKEWNQVIEYIETNGDENDELLDENDQSYEGVDTRTARSNG